MGKGANMKSRVLQWIAHGVVVFGSGQGIAQASLEDRIGKLEETIQALQRRIASQDVQIADLEKLRATATFPPASDSWRSLKRGMTESSVVRLLGQPYRIVTMPTYAVWSYGAGSRIAGEVRFNKGARLEGWSEPPPGPTLTVIKPLEKIEGAALRSIDSSSPTPLPTSQGVDRLKK
jgi:hypothetical protein